jgi:hypothetical protein
MIGEISMQWFYKLRLQVRSRFRKARVDQELGAKYRFNPILPATASFYAG